jgi:HNH endonuclease
VAFAETQKLAVRRKAHFSCCLCHALGVEVHHVLPQAEGGTDTQANAAPLCPSCHETYGANPVKRKFIREARDFWYELCAKRYSSDPDRLDEISEQLKNAATKADLDAAVAGVIRLIEAEASRKERTVPQRAQEVGRLGAMIAPGVGTNRHCKKCGTTIGLFVGDQGRCPDCGTPW